MASNALPFATAAAQAFGSAASGGMEPMVPPGGGGPAAFRSAGLNVGSRVVGGGRASTDGQTSAETQAATAGPDLAAAPDPLGTVGPAPAWYARPAVIFAAVATGLGLLFAVILLARRQPK